jgi:hypothetical protein
MRRPPRVVLGLVVASALSTAACPALDVAQPIALVPGDDWTASEVALLAGAADCWDQEFGTQLSVGRTVVDQQVEVVFNDFVCTYAGARTEPARPVKISLCRDLSFDYIDDLYFPFYILLHELGHVLNIRVHSDGAYDVMSSGYSSAAYWGGVRQFSDEDHRLLTDANPDFVQRPTCAQGVVFRALPGSELWGCACR